jgi:hypothetical protein
VYAFRRVFLGIHEMTSPPDPTGVWYDPNLVAVAERRKREGKGKPATERDREEWARSLGWRSWLERQDAIARNEERYAAGLKWQREHAAELRAAKNTGFQNAAAALGVKATEPPPF